MGSRVLRKIQVGKETDHGTAVAADTRWVGEITLPDQDREVVIPEAGAGLRVPGILDNAYVERVLADGISYGSGDQGGYFQILPALLSMCVMNEVGTEQNVGEGDYLWEFDFPLTAAEDVDSFTIEVGDDTQAYEMAYCLARSLTITGNAETGESTISADIFGDEIATADFTAAQTISAVQYINPKLTTLAIDDTWAGLAGTPLTAALLDWSLTINGGVHPKRRGSSSLQFDSHGQDKISVDLSLTLERTAAVVTEAAKFYATTTDPRFIQLEIDSGVIIGAGANHKLTIQLAAIPTAWSLMGSDQDGNTLDVVQYKVGYDLTGTKAALIQVTTNVSAI